MHSPNIDKRDSQDIKKQIAVLAKQYVPEWRYDTEDPDVGSVLSEIFAGMFENTISNFNRSPYNHYIAFLNLLGAKLLPPVSSTGMVTVDLVPGTKGVFIKRGAQLYAPANNKEGRVYYETVDAMYATDSKIESIYITDSKEDRIVNIYDNKKDEKILPFKIYNDNGFENLQAHEIYFGNERIFNLKDKTDITFKFYDKRSLKNNEELPSIFSDSDNVTWQVYDESGWKTIEDVRKLEDGVRLISDNGIGKSNVVNVESNFVRCLFKRIPKNNLKFTDVTYVVQSSDLEPDTMLLDTSELSRTDFFPFGEQYSIYTDFYISSEEAFVKSGSNVKINIDMQYVKVELQTAGFQDNTRYKYIMSELDFKEPEEADVEIERVTWEYWNGRGWAKIYNNNENEDFFKMTEDNSKTKKVLEFICPDDMQKVVLGPKESCFIRARILKVKNPFTTLGSYITPYIHNISIDYRYIDKSVTCNEVYVRSNMEEKIISLKDDEVPTLLKEAICKHPTMYFCLSKPIENGPIKVLFDIETGVYLDIPSLRWEYYAKDNQGNYVWKNIDVLDLTDNLSNSAIVSMIGKNDFAKTELFGREGYFLRIVNHDDKYYEKKKGLPIINGIYFNTVQVTQIETRVPEYFSIDNVQANKVCNLSSNNIAHADVWVNEFGNLSSVEESNIVNSKDDSYIIEYNDKGRITEIWVKWEPISNIACASMNERVFEVDYNKGTITFGDGRHGKIPTHQDQQSIRVEYSVSSGSIGNIEAQSIQGFSEAIPFVRSVKNLKQLVGGVDMETVSNAAKRMSSKIAGMNRIVTLDDFESAIKCNDRNIYKVKCIPHVDNMSRKSIGTISVAILPKDYMKGYEKFLVIKNRVESFIKDSAPLTFSETSNLKVFEVMYVEVSVKADLVIDNYNNYQSLYQDIYKKLKTFLDPINGNFNKQGWDIGSLPRKESVYNYIKSAKNIRWIKSVNLFTKAVTLEGKKDIDLEEVSKQYFTIPVFGEPEISIMVE